MIARDELRRRLAGVPDPTVARPAAVDDAIGESVRYLASDAAVRSLAADVYWPKWDSPWWHMLLLWEVGEAQRTPERAVDEMVRALAAFPIKIFPLRDDELPPGANLARDVICHCALGSIYQVLAACGRDVDRALPWAEPWFVRYQMADGGLSCDDAAYRVEHECPSSMVGTVAPLEAMLLGRPDAWSPGRAAFVERAGQFLIGRRVMLGSPTVHNAEERIGQTAWLAPCFPRFYFYDVLRGLAALVRWAEATGRAVPLRAITGVIDHLLASFPEGIVHRQRLAFAAAGTWTRAPSGEWQRLERASRFALLDATSAIGEPCPRLTRQWTETRRGLLRLLDAGRILGAD